MTEKQERFGREMHMRNTILEALEDFPDAVLSPIDHDGIMVRHVDGSSYSIDVSELRGPKVRR